MPFRRKYSRKRRYSRKGRKRKFIKRRRRGYLIKKQPFPPFLRRRFSWIGHANVTSSATLPVTNHIKLNSLYDPDHNNVYGNTSCSQFNKLMSSAGPYLEYFVNSWVATVTVTNRSDSNLMVAYKVNGSSFSAYDTFAEYVQNNRPLIKQLGSRIGGKPSVTIRQRGSARAYMQKGEDNEYRGTYNTDPTSVIIGSILVYDQQGLAIDVNILVRVEFDATLHLRQLQQPP